MLAWNWNWTQEFWCAERRRRKRRLGHRHSLRIEMMLNQSSGYQLQRISPKVGQVSQVDRWTPCFLLQNRLLFKIGADASHTSLSPPPIPLAAPPSYAQTHTLQSHLAHDRTHRIHRRHYVACASQPSPFARQVSCDELFSSAACAFRILPRDSDEDSGFSNTDA